MMTNLKNHWNNVYQTKKPNEVSWTQDNPATSLEFIRSFNLPKTASIIDIGGGDSKLVDCLLDEGFVDVSVLDISASSLENAKKRLGNRASMVTWIVADINEFTPPKKYDLWHDRAAFHFLTTETEVRDYLNIVRKCVQGYMVVGTFSPEGPEKCSGLHVKQYSDDQLTNIFSEGFKKIRCITVDHITPFNTKQNFTFCSFKSSMLNHAA